MKIAFDAKRAYQNKTGLGHYSRTLITSVATFFPKHQYYLCAPKITDKFDISSYPNVKTIVPVSFVSKKLQSLWRSNWVKSSLVDNSIDLYHGLSHEIPVGIQHTNIRSVVTIHDLIFERYPGQYRKIDVQIYRYKFKYACKHANQIIAISEQTKQDLVDFYHVDPNKIHVCYQSCNQSFATIVSDDEKQRIRQLYGLPDRYFLYVGSIIERKNLLNICRALKQLKKQEEIRLVVIGEGGAYKGQVMNYLVQNKLEGNVLFLSDTVAGKSSIAYQTGADFPAIYQLSQGLIYPSIFEGFGIPVLEALWSQTPVIASNQSCLPETGGAAALYVDPNSAEQIAEAMEKLLRNQLLVQQMKKDGLLHAQKFTPEKCASKVMEVYLRTHDRSNK